MIQEENIILSKFIEKYPKMVLDGIANIDMYKVQILKVLYILKEANGGEKWDLREFINKGGRSQTWNNIGLWQYGIENYESGFDWNKLKNKKDYLRKKHLKNIAVINLKKNSGGATSNMKEIENYFKEDKELLLQQVKCYDPDIVICCGTGKILKDNNFFGNDLKWNISGRKVEFTQDENEKIILSFKHPQSRIKSKKLFFDVVKTLREINNKKF